MVFSFARVGAVNTLRVGDYFEKEKRWWLRLHEKGGKRHEVPCHHTLGKFLDDWVRAAGIGGDKKGWLFPRIGKADRLTKHRMDSTTCCG
jgi:integrase/recombinase XerD